MRLLLRDYYFNYFAKKSHKILKKIHTVRLTPDLSFLVQRYLSDWNVLVLISISTFVKLLKIYLKKLIFSHVIAIGPCNWLIRVNLEDLWVSLCSIQRFDLYAAPTVLSLLQHHYCIISFGPKISLHL